MEGLANLVGKFLGQLPVWLFWPALVMITIFAALFIFSDTGIVIGGNKRAYLGEKKDDRKRK
ncbi:hypothetical protein CVV43_00490 [Candidatus Saccharibacteria bacterium HGW-Saccharibacteria-1]|jgi:hypothetical protein|nr:MAG: hypothetical protein CVV43_00490 [Candidatus Saccharibacteria bacterium HGW-Saccharibacteria-1]